MRLALSYTHQAQFAGFYAADRLGYYEDEGLDVRFVPRDETDPLDLLAQGQAEFALTSAANVVVRRAAGDGFVAVGAVYQASPLVLLSLAGSGIERLQEIRGKTVATNPTSMPVLAGMARYVGLEDGDYRTIGDEDKIAKLIDGRADVIQGYLMNEPRILEEQGHEVNIMYADDYGYHAYTDAIVVTDDYLGQERGTVDRFVRASLRGWTYAVAHPNEIPAMVSRYNPDADAEHELNFLLDSLPLIVPEGEPVGSMDAADWTSVMQVLLDQGAISEEIDVQDLFTTDFIPDR